MAPVLTVYGQAVISADAEWIGRSPFVHYLALPGRAVPGCVLQTIIISFIIAAAGSVQAVTDNIGPHTHLGVRVIAIYYINVPIQSPCGTAAEAQH
jgi:hypothetical protein